MKPVIVVGPPCAGKSTWVDRTMKPGDVRVDFNRISKALGGVESHEPGDPVLNVAFAARGGAVSRALEGDFPDSNAYIIHSVLNDEWLERYRQADAEFYVLDPGEQVCLARAIFENRPPGTEDRIRKWYQNPPDIQEAHTVKNSAKINRKDPTGQVRSKVANISLKVDAADGPSVAEGEFTGYAAVFGNVDSYGDKIAKGAFAESLGQYAEKGVGVPVYWSHQMSDPMMNIGVTKSASEDDHGLLVHAKLDLDNPNGAQVHKLIKEGRVNQMSFAYEVEEAAWVDEAGEDGESFFELRKLKLFEVSVVQVGANQATELLDVKARLEDQRALTDKSTRAKLVKAAELITEVMDEEADPSSVAESEPEVEEPTSDGKEDPQGSSETGGQVKSRRNDPKHVYSQSVLRKYV